jgi:hypothetical protein
MHENRQRNADRHGAEHEPIAQVGTQRIGHDDAEDRAGKGAVGEALSKKDAIAQHHERTYQPGEAAYRDGFEEWQS